MSQLVICLCSYGGKVDRDQALALAGVAAASGRDVAVFEDFCAVAAGVIGREKLTDDLTVVGCRRRALASLLTTAKITGEAREFAEVAKEYESLTPVAFTGEIIPYGGEWRAWFPVIDFVRCIQCGKCLEYCLFGVYGRDEKVTVAHPGNCKNNCPACARICPVNAVIFAKYPESPIDGGEDKVEVSADAGGLAAQLKERREKRKSIFKDRNH